MAQSVPEWFQADRVFAGRNGWHIGSPSGLSVGPYTKHKDAAQASRAILAELESIADRELQAAAVRRFVREQTASILARDPAARVIRVRVGERSRHWVRSSRYFQIGDAWFFHTREGVDVGPYGSEAEVKRDAERLVEILKGLNDEPEAVRRDAVLGFLNTAEANSA